MEASLNSPYLLVPKLLQLKQAGLWLRRHLQYQRLLRRMSQITALLELLSSQGRGLSQKAVHSRNPVQEIRLNSIIQF